MLSLQITFQPMTHAESYFLLFDLREDFFLNSWASRDLADILEPLLGGSFAPQHIQYLK